MIGGHLDSWHTGVGATDNADGSTTVMEAMRILKAIGARPRRTIRVALWGGEEQGLLGSKAWVAAAPRRRRPTPPRATSSTSTTTSTTAPGDLRLVPAEPGGGPADLRQLARAAEERSARAATSSEPVGSTDHLSFIDAGVPGFNPIQDYGNYDIRTHHTNMDTVDRLDVERHPPGGDRHGDVRVSVGDDRSEAAEADSKVGAGPEARTNGVHRCPSSRSHACASGPGGICRRSSSRRCASCDRPDEPKGISGSRCCRTAGTRSGRARAGNLRESMKAFMHAAPHGPAMRRLLEWCDEASLVHWPQDDPELPDWAEAHRRLESEGRPSKVHHPSAAHTAHRFPLPAVRKTNDLRFKR